MGAYAVEMEQLAAVSSMLSAAADDARARLEVLRHSAEQLTGRWQDAAGSDYRHGWAEWHAGAIEMITALHEMALAVGMSGRDYATTEGAVQAAVAGSSA